MPSRRPAAAVVAAAALVPLTALTGCTSILGTDASVTTTTTRSGVLEETLPQTTTTPVPSSVPKTPRTTLAPATAAASGVLGAPSTIRTTVNAPVTTPSLVTTTTVIGPCPTASQVSAAVDRWTMTYQATGTKANRPFGTWTVTVYGHVSNDSDAQISIDSLMVKGEPPESIGATVPVPVPNVPAHGTRQWLSQYRHIGYATAADGTPYQQSDWTNTVSTFAWAPVAACR